MIVRKPLNDLKGIPELIDEIKQEEMLSRSGQSMHYLKFALGRMHNKVDMLQQRVLDPKESNILIEGMDEDEEEDDDE